MKVKVEYTAQLKAIAGVSWEYLDTDEDIDLLKLIDIISGKHGKKLKEYIMTDDGTVLPAMMLAINNERVYANDSVILKEDDTVSFLSPMAGG